jgi:hypothetical protein
MRRVLISIAVVGVLVGALLPAAAGAPAAGTIKMLASGTAAVPRFGTPTPMVFGNGFETDLRMDDHPTATSPPIDYSAAPQSLSSTISTLQRSLDGGLTWKLVPGQLSGLSGGKNMTCPIGGGDAELDVANHHLYYNDLTLVPGFSVARSDNEGTDFSAGTNCAGVVDTGTDRPWYAHIGDPTNGGREFLVYDEADGATGAQNCAQTNPGGNVLVVATSPVPGAPGSTAGIQFTNARELSCDEGIMGNDETFTYRGGHSEFFVIHDNNALNSVSVVRCDIVAPSPPLNNQGLANCADHRVTSFPHFRTGANFPTMAVDTAGNLYAVWEQAPVDSSGNVIGNTQLYFATSTTKGNTWSKPTHIPTPGLNQDVFAWPGAGDPGRIDVGFYGAPEPWVKGDTHGPDSINGHYGLYVVQNLNALSAPAGWSSPVEASQHAIHYGTMYTLIGGQNGNRTLGDFIQLRIGPDGEANIAYSDSNNQNSSVLPEAMFVRQNGGPSVYAKVKTVNLPPAPTGGCVSGDPPSVNPADDATFDAAGRVGSNNANLDIARFCFSQPNTADYRAQFTVANLSSFGPDSGAGGSTNIWQVQWHVPASYDAKGNPNPNGGNLFMAYAESVAGGTPTCWVGQAAGIAVGGGVEMTYPGTTQLTGSNCVVKQSTGTITITIPKADVSTAPYRPNSATLYSVTASTQTLNGNAETPPVVGGLGGQLFNVIDVAPAFDFN